MGTNRLSSKKTGIPGGNTASRPSDPVIGDTYYNGTLEILEIYNGTAWVASSASPATPTIATPTNVGTGLAYTTGGSLTVVFTPGSGGGTPTQYNAYTTTGGFSASSSSTTVTLTGLTPETAFTVYGNAQNNFGATTNTANASAVTVTTKPQAPTIGTATESNESATVAYTANATGGSAITTFTATSSPSGLTGTGSSPITVSGLTNGTAYTFTVTATNANGTSSASSASNSVTPVNTFSVDYLVVAGGGGGGGGYGGGGGAGGYRTSIGATALLLYSLTNYTVTVGANGTGGPSVWTQGTGGGSSTFSTITSSGGGKGAAIGDPGGNGGSGGGGGGGYWGTPGTKGYGNSGGFTPVEGYNGGNGSDSDRTGGGGGGAGGAGVDAPTSTQGAGVTNNITGSSVTYCKGGYGTTARYATVNSNSSENGNGGSGCGESAWPAQNGFVGIIVLRYPSAKTITFGAGVTGTESAASGGYKRATITAATAGNVSWS